MSDELRLIEGAERDRLILDILNRTDADTQTIASPDRHAAWEKGWQERLHAFRASRDERDLIPQFIRSGQPVRWRQQFYQPADPEYELNYVRSVQNEIGDRMIECDSIHEFGCGTGLNLLAMKRRYPQKSVHGYDFSQAAVSLTEEAGRELGVQAHVFDMIAPWGFSLGLGRNAGVFTFGAIEQLGTHGFQKFIDYLIARRPRIVVHIEPVPELLDPDNLVDALSLRFHRRRGYTEGLLGYLHERVNILEVERSWFGSLMLESYARIVWRAH